MSNKVKTRFAPSPTGYLHVGGARTALYSWLYAKKMKGTFVLRIEDTDQARSTQESIDMVLSDLKALHLDWQEGPEVGGEHGPYKQSERKEIYKEHGQRLINSSQAYYCFCTDEVLEAKREKAKADGLDNYHYDGTCRNISKEEAEKRLNNGETATVRFKLPEAKTEFKYNDIVRNEVVFPTNMVGDFIILRSDGMPVYNFCCVVDDALMGINFVLRAEEHLSNTLRQGLLYEAFNYPLPHFGHLSLILGEDKQKLSKRHGATSVNEYLKQGILAEALINYLALLGWSAGDDKEIYTVSELIESFSLERLNGTAAVFDTAKMMWMNTQHLRSLKHEELWKRIVPFLEEEGFKPHKEELWQSIEWRDKALSLFKQSMETLKDATAKFKLVSQDQFEITEEGKETLSWEQSKIVIETWKSILEKQSCEVLTEEQFASIQNEVKDICNVKAKNLFMPIRVAVVGMPQGADLKQLVPLLPIKVLLQRAEIVLQN